MTFCRRTKLKNPQKIHPRIMISRTAEASLGKPAGSLLLLVLRSGDFRIGLGPTISKSLSSRIVSHLLRSAHAVVDTLADQFTQHIPRYHDDSRYDDKHHEHVVIVVFSAFK